MSAPSAVVFAYHDVGVRCLAALVSARFEIPLVVTHEDDPYETRWFASVADTAAAYDVPVIKPPDPNTPQIERHIASLRPDFIFSFYYRSMLAAPVLNAARRGALNMHGSLLPKYRGRAPVNWAILRGERQTGVTLHYMVERADAGDIVDQLAVPILQDDDARLVFSKITVAAEIVLARCLPGLVDGTATRRPQDLASGEYVGRRRPEDGRIDWRRPALDIHNLVRAVAPPFPGAFADIDGQRWMIHRTRMAPNVVGPDARPTLFGAHGRCYVACSDGGVLEILAAAIADQPTDVRALAQRLARAPIRLTAGE